MFQRYLAKCWLKLLGLVDTTLGLDWPTSLGMVWHSKVQQIFPERLVLLIRKIVLKSQEIAGITNVYFFSQKETLKGSCQIIGLTVFWCHRQYLLNDRQCLKPTLTFLAPLSLVYWCHRQYLLNGKQCLKSALTFLTFLAPLFLVYWRHRQYLLNGRQCLKPALTFLAPLFPEIL